MPDKIITLGNLGKFKEALDVQTNAKLAQKASLVDGKVPMEQLPPSFDDVREYDSFSAMPQEGESGVLYIAKDTNKQYRYDGGYVELSQEDELEFYTVESALQPTARLSDDRIEKAKKGKLIIRQLNPEVVYFPIRREDSSPDSYLYFRSSTHLNTEASTNNVIKSCKVEYYSRRLRITGDGKGVLQSATTNTCVAIADNNDNFFDATTQPSQDGKQLIRALNLYRTQAMLADNYDASTTYAVGDYAIYQNQLYACNTAISVAEAWNADHWTLVNVASVMEAMEANKQDKLVSGSNIKTINGNSLLGSGNISVGGVEVVTLTNTSGTISDADLLARMFANPQNFVLNNNNNIYEAAENNPQSSIRYVYVSLSAGNCFIYAIEIQANGSWFKTTTNFNPTYLQTKLTTTSVADGTLVTTIGFDSSGNVKKATMPDVSGKQDSLVTGVNIKSVNGISLLGPGDFDTNANLAEEYDATATYDVGDVVVYQHGLYRCISAIETAEAWDATHWAKTTVIQVIKYNYEKVANQYGNTLYLVSVHTTEQNAYGTTIII